LSIWKNLKNLKIDCSVRGVGEQIGLPCSSEPKAPTSLDVAPPPLAVQPFRVGDEGDALKIASKLSLPQSRVMLGQTGQTYRPLKFG